LNLFLELNNIFTQCKNYRLGRFSSKISVRGQFYRKDWRPLA